ncbi:hypothetical protein BGZ73_002676 [Actinomortierella ambigua]|nr:hypothetical protein BGZ73_002676 [Actinomortierella ambigua]
MVPCIAIILCFWVADLRRVIRFNVPHQTRIVYTVIYALYFLLGVAIGFIVQRLLPFKRHRPLIAIYWVLISATVLEGIYFGVLMSKQKGKLITFCDPSLPSIQPTPPRERPITCRHQHNSVIGALYIIGPAGWLVLHVGWILMAALLCKALRLLYVDSPGLDNLSKYCRQRSSHLPASLEPVAVHLHDPVTEPATQPIHDVRTDYPTRDEEEFVRATHYDDQHLRRPSLGFRHASEQFYLSVKSKLSMHRSSDPSHSPPKVDEVTHEPSSDDEEEEVEQDATGGSSFSHRGSQSSVSAGKQPASMNGKGWWIRQLEAKRRGEFCPCTDEDGRHLPEPIEGCWCGRPRVTNT